jgi:hypothetical protein
MRSHLIDKRRQEFRRARIAPVVVHHVAPDEITVEVYRDHHVGPERAADGDGYRIDQTTVDKPAMVVPRRTEDARYRNRRADCLFYRPFS